MAVNLKADEQAAVAEIEKVFANLSPEAQKIVAEGVSWAETHFWPWTLIVAVAFLALGYCL